jgi:hypothetical protein
MGPARAPCLGPLAQLVRALPCHGRGRRFKSVMDRKARRCEGTIFVLRITNKIPGKACKCQWGLLQFFHDQRTNIK